MSDTSPVSPKAAAKALPSFADVFRGIWLMTWRSQLTLRKLPGLLAILLVLPLLVYLTVMTPEAWKRKRQSFGSPRDIMSSFTWRLRPPLKQTTFEAIQNLVDEEIRNGEDSWQNQPGEEPEARQKRQKELVTEIYERMLPRAQPMLDEGQYSKFEDTIHRQCDKTIGRLTEVTVPWGRTEPFYHWLIEFYFFTILPMACVRGCGPLIRDELQADTLGFLITRPIGRARLLVAKFAAQVAWLEIILLVETLLVFAAGLAKQVTPLGPLLPLVLGVQILVVPAWSALGLLLGQLTGRYMAMALLYGAIVEMGIGRIPTNINALSIIRHLQTLLAYNHELQSVFSWPAGDTPVALAALLVAPVLFLSLSALLFTLIEYHHAAEMQK